MSTLIKTEIKSRSTDFLLKEDIPAYTFSPSALLKMEKEILGIYVSAHPLSYYRQELTIRLSPKQICIRSHHISQLKTGQSVLIAGLLIQVRRQFTKHHEVMAFLLLEDETGLFEAIAFPEVFHNHFSLFVKDKLLMIKGIVNNKNGDTKLIIQKMTDIHSCLKIWHNQI